MGVPVFATPAFSKLGVAGAVPGQGLIDFKPLTDLAASPVIITVPWPDPSQNQIAVFRSVTRLHILKNDDPDIYAGVALFLRRLDQAIMGVAILDAGMPGWGTSAAGGILGLVDREIDVSPDYFIVKQPTTSPAPDNGGGFIVTFKPFSLNSVATDSRITAFRADVDLAYAWALLASNGKLLDTAPQVVQLEATGKSAGGMLVLKSDGTMWTATDGTLANPVWIQVATP